MTRDGGQSLKDRAMQQPGTMSRVFIGPFGLHAVGGVVLALFVLFLWAFNFTAFF
jgi:hypothetical protein